jgi:iron complex outermembrane recepter protein
MYKTQVTLIFLACVAIFNTNNIYAEAVNVNLNVNSTATIIEEAAPETIIVTANKIKDRNYSQNTKFTNNTMAIDSLGNTIKLSQYPAQINIIKHKDIANKQAQTLADVVKQDTSVNQNYAPLGYQENFSIRGSTLNLDSSYMLNGVPTSNRQIASLANKEAVLIAKGINASETSPISGGGSINYITKRAKDITQATIQAQGSGEFGASIDIGRTTNINNTKNDYMGYRINAEGVSLKPYVKTATGHKHLLSLALDGKYGDVKWQIDGDYSNHTQYSVPGYQLLGGNDIPQNVQPKTMLNNPEWRKPVDTTSYNLGGKVDVGINKNWGIKSSLQYSNINIDDYVAFPYSFKTNGDYKLADYQSLDLNYKNIYSDVAVNGKVYTGPIKHNITLGISAADFEKSGRDSITAGKETRNIYNPELIIKPYKATGEYLAPAYRQLKNTQTSIFARDVLSYDKAKLYLGGRFVHMNEQAKTSLNSPIIEATKSIFLPNVAAVYNINSNLGVYTQYAQNIEIGKNKDIVDYNASYLPARKVKQFELGLNYADKISKAGLALFNTSKPFEYIDNYAFFQEGTETRRGIEANVSTNYGALAIGGGATYFLKAKQDGTSVDSYNNVTSVNIPKFKSNIWAEYAIMPHTYINGAWNYEASKVAKKDASISIPAHNTFDLGLRYDYKLAAYKTKSSFKLNVENITNKNYWKDAGEAFGENYIHLGAPRTYKASLTMDF